MVAMEVVYKKLGLRIIADKTSDDLVLVQKICSVLENLPKDIRGKVSKAVIRPDFYFAVELYKNKKITLGKFSNIVGLSIHDSAKLLESLGVKVELGAASRRELEEELETAKGIA